jgi:hypothetical protein
MSWSSYAELARQLDSVRRTDAERTARQRHDAESGRVTLDRLVDRLTGQQADLTHAADLLRTRMRRIDPGPGPARTLAEALRQAEQAADASDQAREEALLRAKRPQFLPDASPVARNAAVYGLCAAVALVFQTALALLAERVDTVTAALWALCGLPVIAFFVGYLAIGVVAVPRIPPTPAQQDRTGRRTGSKPSRADPDRSPRLGFAICFLALPVAWLMLVLLRGFAG